VVLSTYGAERVPAVIKSRVDEEYDVTMLILSVAFEARNAPCRVYPPCITTTLPAFPPLAKEISPLPILMAVSPPCMVEVLESKTTTTS